MIKAINAKPICDFVHAKVLGLKDLLGYIKYFKPVFSTREVQEISDLILEINKKKVSYK